MDLFVVKTVSNFIVSAVINSPASGLVLKDSFLQEIQIIRQEIKTGIIFRIPTNLQNYLLA